MMLGLAVAGAFLGLLAAYEASRSAVPVLNVGDLMETRDPKRIKVLAQRLREACETYGAFYLTGTMLDEAYQGQVFDRASQLFSMPLEEKMELMSDGDGPVRGYIPKGGESGSTAFAEWKEGFSYGYDWKEDSFPSNPNSLEAENVWPDNASIRIALQDVYTHLTSISYFLVDMLAASLDEDPSVWQASCSHGHTISLMRLFHYFPRPANNTGLIGSSPHTDWGFLTLILQDSSGVELSSWLRWRPIRHQKGAILVNVGDYLSLLSRSKYMSPLHRVTLGEKDRHSFVFFFYPNYETRINDLAADVDTKGYSSFKMQSSKENHDTLDATTIPFGEFMAMKWKQVQRK